MGSLSVKGATYSKEPNSKLYPVEYTYSLHSAICIHCTGCPVVKSVVATRLTSVENSGLQVFEGATTKLVFSFVCAMCDYMQDPYENQ